MTAAKRHRSVRRVEKPKLLLDEGMPPRRHLHNLNQYCDTRHIKQDFRLGGKSDELVYKVACEEERILVTFNIKDFRSLLQTGGASIIGLSANLTNHQIDSKLTSLVKQLRPAQFHGQFFIVTGETNR